MMELQAYDSVMTPTADGHWVLKSNVNKCISDLTAEIERLKEYEALYKGAVLAFEDERKEHIATRRALWLARAARAEEHCHRYIGTDYCNWVNVEKLCRAKAEEYK